MVPTTQRLCMDFLKGWLSITLRDFGVMQFEARRIILFAGWSIMFSKPYNSAHHSGQKKELPSYVLPLA